MEHEMNVRNMMWRPRMIRLTCIPNPDVDEGAPTPAYCDPQDVRALRRMKGSYMTFASYGKRQDQQEYHPAVDCTEVHLGHALLLVQETPDEIAKMRDAAFGHQPEDPAPGTVSTLRSV